MGISGDAEISVGQFVSRLTSVQLNGTGGAALSLPELLRYGHFRGWLEDQDERNPAEPLNRQTAARIVHLFLLIECGVQDLPDITPATTLKDLYTCRVCANHIAQVYTRGIMGEKKEESDFPDSSALFFNHLAAVSKAEAGDILSKLEQLL
jgi:hypothetical protein